MDGDAETVDTKPKEAESTKESPSQCTLTSKTKTTNIS